MKTSEVYETAADLIVKRGLAHGLFYDRKAGTPGEHPLCLIAALCVALGLPLDWAGWGGPDETDGEFEKRRAVFAAAVDPLLLRLGLGVAADDVEGVVSYLGFGWSDKHTAEQVVTELRAAAGELRAGES